ncbi:PepSY domain-containing protein [Phyllobacterium sp. TAF24]|uniref:PepSY domain-containing protein n=1 Tax=Phyllobacterium sp. TAF24 TaxID=3233068 RepID=UPI003F946530
MHKVLVMAGAAALMVVSSAPSYAQSIEIGPGGVRLVEPQMERSYRRISNISERTAVRIARAEGLRDVDDVTRTRSRFIIEGTDYRGDDIKVSVDRRTGEVISVD